MITKTASPQSRRRLRVIAKLAGIVLLAILIGPFPGGIGAAGAPARPLSMRTYTRYDEARLHTVAQGETLWEIAQVYFPEDDPRCSVETIKLASGLDRRPLQPGDVLVIPIAPSCS
jgi:hypothetical protein